MPKTEDTYLTVAGTAESTSKEKGSKFIALVYPVTSEEQIKEALTNVRKKYYDASHHCYAFILGEKGQLYRANDDGEPNHSAGDPILGQIRSYKVTDVLVVVVRYFGGIKLGVSGLVNTYKTAAAEALSQAQVIERVIQAQFNVSFDYLWMNPVMKLVKEFEMVVISQQFAESCQMNLSVRRSLLEGVKARFAQLDIIVK